MKYCSTLKFTQEISDECFQRSASGDHGLFMKPFYGVFWLWHRTWCQKQVIGIALISNSRSTFSFLPNQSSWKGTKKSKGLTFDDYLPNLFSDDWAAIALFISNASNKGNCAGCLSNSKCTCFNDCNCDGYCEDQCQCSMDDCGATVCASELETYNDCLGSGNPEIISVTATGEYLNS